MSIGTYCRRPACTVTDSDTLRAAAQRMDKEGVGLLVVTHDGRLEGVITDRDVALHIVGGERDASESRVADAMSRQPVSVDPDDSLEVALSRMAYERVRRLVVATDERVDGVLSADDLMLLLARELSGLGEVLVAQLPAGSSRTVGSGAEEPSVRRPAEHYAREVVTAPVDASVAAVARTLEDEAVGCAVVVDDDGRAVGLVTDRDLALRVVAAGRHAVSTRASQVMSTPLLSADPAEPLEEVIGLMRTQGLRRVPILRDGRPVGLVSFDDLLVALGHELEQLAHCVAGEIRWARLLAVPARMREDFEDRVEEAATRLVDAGDRALRALGRELEQVFERVTQVIGSPGARELGSHLTVADLMQRDVQTCSPEEPLDRAARILWERDCGCVPVIARDGSGRVVGMVTDRDICMASLTTGARLSELAVRSAMSSRVVACQPGDDLAAAAERMRKAQVRRLPVVDGDGRLRGLLSLADLAAAAAGLQAPAGAVSAAEVGLLLEAICRPRRLPARE